MRHLWKPSSEYQDDMICTQCDKVVTGYGWTAHRVELVLEPCVSNKPTDVPITSPIESPAHYTSTTVEPIDAIEAWDLNFRLANVVKYIARCGKKPGIDPTNDLRKARAYLNREIARLEGRRAWN